MGDRTYCSLYCYRDTPLNSQEREVLTSAIKSACPDAVSDNFAGFDEVNYGNIDKTLASVLEEMSISYQWFWGPGGGYNSGILIFDAHTKESDRFSTIDSEIVINVDCTTDELEHARRWKKRLEGRTPLFLPNLL